MKSTNFFSTVALTTALSTTPAIAQENQARTTQQQYHDQLIALCANPKIVAHLENPDQVCVSSDD